MIKGLVQGVGFRPFVYRTALQYGLSGEVDNRTNGVSIIVEGDIKTIDRFSNDIIKNAPPASDIKSIEMFSRMVEGYDNFSIVPSKNIEDQITEVSPDIAVCRECLDDMDNDPLRIDYPFVNCTNCGPRFSIVETLPYDRHGTAMKEFEMCPDCKTEYNNVMDRRFHAQPVACNSCGPSYIFKEGTIILTEIRSILKATSELIAMGKTVAIKGLGGFHLMCDALNDKAVTELRRKKQRDSKPFAVMFKDLNTVNEYCYLTEEEIKEFTSWRRPVLILGQKKVMAAGINNGLNTTGAVLPYMPIHYLLFKVLKTPAVVLTSGNMSEEPIITDDAIAEREFAGIADALISYNRKIVNRTDDSVVRIIDHRPSIIRRSRGYVPRPVDLRWNAEGILALGAEQKNSFCMGKGNQAILSQYIGDIKNKPTYDFLKEAIDRFSILFRFKPLYLSCDLHPDYLSTQYAELLRQKLDIPLFRVQHHHAHIASCMAEHGLDEPVIGISFDGTGFGTDGTLWGGEFLVAELRDFIRYSFFDPVPLPGGEKAIHEPWRTACSYLIKYMGRDFDLTSVPALRNVGESKLKAIVEMLTGNVHSPLSSGAGRLFDAVAALLGLCTHETFDSEAPVRLESAIRDHTEEFYPFTAGKPVIFKDTFSAIIKELPDKSPSLIAAKFHNTIARVILDVSEQIRRETSLNKVVLSGGVFQNKYLLERSSDLLRRNRFLVFTNNTVPSNDGGISLGQLIIASKSIV